jgi:hypothetical protein
VKRSFRPTFAVLLAALALACAGLGAHGGADADTGRTPAPMLRRTGAATARLDAQRTLALAFLRGGTPALGGLSNRPGTLPRVAPGSPSAHTPSFHALHAVHRYAGGACILSISRPPFARRLAAARDGTLSARSTGVPPPAA